MQPEINRIDISLRDIFDAQRRTLPVRIEWRESGINVSPDGYGDATSDPGSGAPIYLELYQGELRLVVWSDINSEEPTHVISLEGAKDERRIKL